MDDPKPSPLQRIARLAGLPPTTLLAIVGAVALCAVLGASYWAYTSSVESRLLRADADSLPDNAALMKFALPRGAGRMVLGYHWTNPDLAGWKNAVVWDDGHNVKFPGSVAAGEAFTVELEIIGPPLPGDRYYLKIEPFIVDHGKKIWLNGLGLGQWVKVNQ